MKNFKPWKCIALMEVYLQSNSTNKIKLGGMSKKGISNVTGEMLIVDVNVSI